MGAKVLFCGDSSNYHCCNLCHLLQQLAPSTIQMAAGQTDHYSHQFYSKLLGAPFIATLRLSILQRSWLLQRAEN